MSETTTIERDGLVDHKLIEDWQAEANAAAGRLVAARLALAKAEGEHASATHASDRAASGGDMADAHQAQLVLEAAARGLVVAQKVFDAAAAAMTRSNERRHIVSGLAHKGLYEDGVRRRIAAARRWDAGRAEMLAAEADRAAADARMHRAMQAGLPDVRGALDGPDPTRTEEQERAHWRSRDMDPDSPRHPARMPTELTAEEARKQGLVRVSRGSATHFVHPSAVASHVAIGWKDLSDD